MTFTITVEPSGRIFSAQPDEAMLAAGIRQGIGLPYGCKDGACGSCKCKLVSGSVVHGAHQSKALSADEEAAGYVLTCCGVAQSDVVIESRQVTEIGAFPIKKMPVRVSALERASHDVMVLRLQLPASDAFQYHAGQYVEFLLRDGDRRSYSMANAPHTQSAQPSLELHLRHMPGGKFTDHVFGAMKEKDILRIEGPYGSFFLREDSTKPMVLLASGTGFAPIKAIIEHMQFKGARPICTRAPGSKRSWPRCRTCVMCPWCRTRCLTTPGPVAPASCTRRCCRIFRTFRATRCMPAVHPSWSTRPNGTTWPRRACPKRLSSPTPSPALRTRSDPKKQHPRVLFLMMPPAYPASSFFRSAANAAEPVP